MTLSNFRLILFAGLLAFALALPLSKWMVSIGWVDHPGSAPHKKHKRPVPFAGGITLLISIFVVGFFADIFASRDILISLLASLIVFFFGLWDDFKGLSAPIKLVGQILASVIVMSLGVRIQLFDPALNWINGALTLIWLVGVTNAFNFVDSMDGLATGITGIASAFFMIVTWDSGQLFLSLTSAILLGLCISVYFYNISPAHLFLGDSGSQWLGFLMAIMAILYNPVGFLRTQSWFVPIMLLGVPLFDMILVVLSRLKRGKPVMRGQFDHTYHRLISLGMSSNRAVLTMHMATMFLGCLAFVTLSIPPLYANIFYAGCLIAGLLLLLYLDDKRRWP